MIKYGEDGAFQQGFEKIKRSNKELLAKMIKQKYEIDVDIDSIFDVQVKRIHAYKRQILNALHIMHLYNTLRENPGLEFTPRTFIFAGKAAPGYHYAKTVIKLINSLGQMINSDETIKGKLKVVYLENYGVSLAERIFPAADISEQIATASKEASGTGNMKFMLNGTVTLGTLDGANVEIKEEVGNSNIVIFGLTADEVIDYYRYGGYSAYEQYTSDIRIKTVVDQLVNGFFPGSVEEFRSLYTFLINHNDEYFVLKDFPSYLTAQQEIEKLYNNKPVWLKMCINNVARAGAFSSNRTILEYAFGIMNKCQRQRGERNANFQRADSISGSNSVCIHCRSRVTC